MAGFRTFPTYQTPYSSSPYGPGVPVSSSSNLPPNFMAPSGAPGFPMNASNMNPQQQQAQRMQAPPNSSTPTQSAPRASPFAGQHNTPPNASSVQSQFATPQNSNPTHLQTSNNQQAQSGPIITPQTPSFPPGSQNAGSSLASPLSPGSEMREKERVTLLLDINRLLLMESVSLQAVQAELKKEESKDSTGSPNAEKEKTDKEKLDKLKTTSQKEYVECMRRLQSNLAYLAAIADRSHKPSSQIPAHPAIMTAPSITTKPFASIPVPPAPAAAGGSPGNEAKKEEADELKPEDHNEDRAEGLRDLYKRLQDLFPGVDFKKEPQMPAANPAARQQQAAAAAQAQKQIAGDQSQQQKMQQDLLRQKVMQAKAQVQNRQS